jgi:hypothetical protein
VSTGPRRTLPDAAKVDLCPGGLGAVLDRVDDLLDNLDRQPGRVASPAKE